MKKRFLFPLICFFYFAQTHAQNNCSNPTPVTICPSVYLAAETNAGMGDDATAPCNIAGEDVVYEITVNNGAQNIYVSIINATSPYTIILEQSSCNSGICNSKSLPAGNSNTTFPVAPSGIFYLWVDAAITITYDISIGGDTGSVWVNIPNTQGNLQLDSSICSAPVFHPSKPFFQVSVNGVYKTNPLTFAPLFVVDTLCVSTFFKNTTGVEAVKRFDFEFNPAGYLLPVTADSIPGFYNTGYWVASNAGNKWSIQFFDAAGTGKGDFTGMPNSCLRYDFCFTVIPLSNIPQLTNVDVLITADGFGAGYSGWTKSGCCPTGFSNCMGAAAGGGPGGNASAFAFAFDDPGGTLPIQLTAFNAIIKNSKAILTWTTASETNNNFFTIEKAPDAMHWTSLDKIKGAGTTTSSTEYTATDNEPLQGTSYYRLVQTDFNGTISYSPIKKVYNGKAHSITVYPNPVSDFLAIEYSSETLPHFILYNAMGTVVKAPVTFQTGKVQFNTSALPRGLYLLVAEQDNVTEKTRVVVGR